MAAEECKINGKNFADSTIEERILLATRQGWSNSHYRYQRPFSLADNSRSIPENFMMDTQYNELMCEREAPEKCVKTTVF